MAWGKAAQEFHRPANCSGLEGDSIHFQTTIPNRVKQADSPRTIDAIDVLQRENEF